MFCFMSGCVCYIFSKCGIFAVAIATICKCLLNIGILVAGSIKLEETLFGVHSRPQVQSSAPISMSASPTVATLVIS